MSFDTTGVHAKHLEVQDQFSVQDGDMIGVTWLTGQAVPFVRVNCKRENVTPLPRTHVKVDEIEVGTERSFLVHSRRRACQKYRVQAIVKLDTHITIRMV